ncbi:hypothetical protein C8R45DRAFT_941548 [Mycena sanguinolenta]|nr:hypothetical protein C8R45DRAFT_941548 [Mycena sanguinolenta]
MITLKSQQQRVNGRGPSTTEPSCITFSLYIPGRFRFRATRKIRPALVGRNRSGDSSFNLRERWTEVVPVLRGRDKTKHLCGSSKQQKDSYLEAIWLRPESNELFLPHWNGGDLGYQTDMDHPPLSLSFLFNYFCFVYWQQKKRYLFLRPVLNFRTDDIPSPRKKKDVHSDMARTRVERAPSAEGSSFSLFLKRGPSTSESSSFHLGLYWLQVVYYIPWWGTGLHRTRNVLREVGFARKIRDEDVFEFNKTSPRKYNGSGSVRTGSFCLQLHESYCSERKNRCGPLLELSQPGIMAEAPLQSSAKR